MISDRWEIKESLTNGFLCPTPILGLWIQTLCQDFYVSAGDLNSDPHVCMVGILSTEPPCLPLPIPLMKKKKLDWLVKVESNMLKIHANAKA